MSTEGCDGNGTVLADAGAPTIYDYVVTTDDLAARTLHFASSRGDDCIRGQRVAVKITDECNDGNMEVTCANFCASHRDEYTCWVCAPGYRIDEPEYRCDYYGCEGKCLKKPPTPSAEPTATPRDTKRPSPDPAAEGKATSKPSPVPRPAGPSPTAGRPKSHDAAAATRAPGILAAILAAWVLA
mmetsp:Transcript_25355/g.76133  ORF Transcript_25355/g.76133 Transcript_25355/m.76133 type:complete len:184 (-) Transcript_25355:22-573(-)